MTFSYFLCIYSVSMFQYFQCHQVANILLMRKINYKRAIQCVVYSVWCVYYTTCSIRRGLTNKHSSNWFFSLPLFYLIPRYMWISHLPEPAQCASNKCQSAELVNIISNSERSWNRNIIWGKLFCSKYYLGAFISMWMLLTFSQKLC